MKFVLSTKFGNQEAGDDTTCTFDCIDKDDHIAMRIWQMLVRKIWSEPE